MKADPADRFGIGQDAGLDGFVFAGGASADPEGQLSCGAKPAGRNLQPFADLHAMVPRKRREDLLNTLFKICGVNRVAFPRPGFSGTLAQSRHHLASRPCEAQDPGRLL
jgi:hypothetical protein